MVSRQLDHYIYFVLKVYACLFTDEMNERMRTECAKLYHVVIVAAICQWRRPCIQISDKCFVHLRLQYTAHAVVNWIQIWQIWRPH